jgi:HlyD family secretion protein
MPSRKKRVLVPVFVVVLAAGIGAGILLLKGRQQESGDRLVLYGNIDIRQVELAFNGSQRIADLLVEEGDRVEKGQLLGVLETERLEAAVARARARAESQAQVVARLEAGTRQAEIRRLRANARAAEVEAANARRTYARLQPLAAQNLESRQSTDDARSAAEAAAARLRGAQEELALAIEGPRQEDIAAARSTLDAYEAELALAQRDLADAHLYAPEAGVIRNRIMEPGDMAFPQRPVYTVALTEPLWVRAYVAEPDLGKIRLGMRAEVRTDSFPGKVYKAWVGFISPTAEFTPKAVETTEVRTSLVYQVRVFVCDPEGELRLGMPATVTIPLDQPHKVEGTGAHGCLDP